MICKEFFLSDCQRIEPDQFFPFCYFYMIEYYRQKEHAAFKNNSFFQNLFIHLLVWECSILQMMKIFLWIFIQYDTEDKIIRI